MISIASLVRIPAIRAYRGAKRHYRRGANIFKALCQNRVGMDIGQNDKAVLYQYLRRLERLDRIG